MLSEKDNIPNHVMVIYPTELYVQFYIKSSIYDNIVLTHDIVGIVLYLSGVASDAEQ